MGVGSVTVCSRTLHPGREIRFQATSPVAVLAEHSRDKMCPIQAEEEAVVSMQCPLEAKMPDPACCGRVVQLIPESLPQSLLWHHAQDII